jgi:hypothetical protein
VESGGAWFKRSVGEFVGQWFSSPVSDFLQTPIDDITGLLSLKAGGQAMGPGPDQINAWKRSIRIMGRAFSDVLDEQPDAAGWSVLFEYAIPRRLSRPDVIVLTNGVVIVIEMKVGASAYRRADRLQALDYARDLRDFHEASCSLKVLPVLCATDAPSSNTAVAGEAWRDTQLVTADDLGGMLLDIDRELGGEDPIDLIEWDQSRYQPTPSILQTARDLYAGQSVREISHAHADNLTETVDEIRNVINRARENDERTLCFVTGVPGSGKTLTGLSAVHEHGSEAAGASIGTYLSGNRPLVEVLRYALARDLHLREGVAVAEAKHRTSVFIQHVHGFISELAGKPERKPSEHVIVFDEAQRAWDEDQMLNKQGIDDSEAGVAMTIMSRVPRWAVIVALVGEGQEINRGEAGINSWISAVKNRPEWNVVMSPHIDHELPLVEVSQRLHLDVGVRAPRAQALADWAELVVDGNATAARAVCPDREEYPIYITRSLNEMRSYLRDRASIDRRTGLLASAQARRLRAFGIEMNGSFQGAIDWPKWFVEPECDVRSSYSLEVAASEFKCQGLELDWVGLCWGSDFLWDDQAGSWRPRRMSGSRWVNDSDAAHATNRYRVLLTRARYGMVVWVPKLEAPVPLVDPVVLDDTANFLSRCGALPIPME